MKQPFVAAEEDTGPIVKAMIDDEPGKSVIGHRGWTSVRELMETVTKVTGMKAEAIQLPEGQSKFEGAGELQVELDECMSFFNEFGYTGGDPEIIDPTQVSFGCWCCDEGEC